MSATQGKDLHNAWHDEYGRATRQQHVRGSITQEVRGTLLYYASAIEHAATDAAAIGGALPSAHSHLPHLPP